MKFEIFFLYSMSNKKQAKAYNYSFFNSSWGACQKKLREIKYNEKIFLNITQAFIICHPVGKRRQDKNILF